MLVCLYYVCEVSNIQCLRLHCTTLTDSSELLPWLRIRVAMVTHIPVRVKKAARGYSTWSTDQTDCLCRLT